MSAASSPKTSRQTAAGVKVTDDPRTADTSGNELMDALSAFGIRPPVAPAASSDPFGPNNGFGFGGFTSATATTTAAAAKASATTTTTTTTATTATPSGTNATPSWIASLSDSVLKADMTSAAADGVVTEAEMAKAFSDLGAELTSTKTTLSAGQLSGLKTIAANLNVGETASSYLTYITNALVNGNAANAQWTGGAATATALGNLAVGTTATQLGELNGKWFLGTDLPSCTVKMSGAPTFTVSYSAVSAPLFAASGPAMTDINQGYLGDCYLLSSLAEVAKQDPAIIQSMITNNGNNTYGVRFFVGGTAEYVTVNNSLANGGTIFNSGTDMWASLVEKAYAEIEASGVITGNTVNYGNSFSTIGNGGAPEYALEEITGASQITDFSAKGASWSKYTYNSALNYQSGSTGLSTATVLSTLVADLAAGDDLVLSSWTNATDSAGRTTLVASHALSIYGYDSATGNLQIRNPWGSESGQTWDTTFEVSLTTLLADGDTITVDNAGKGAVTPTALAPILTAQTAAVAEIEGAKFSYVLAANTFTDPQGAALTLTATQSNGTALPSWLSFNAATQTFSGTAPTTAGTTTVTVKATDTYGLSVSDTFTISSVAPKAPVLATQTANLTEATGVAFSYTVASGTFSDPNGSALTYSATQSNGAALPSWLSFNAATDTFSGTPSVAGTTTISLKATDAFGLSVTENFSITAAAPKGPVLANQTANQTWTLGQAVNFALASNTFSDTKAMTYSAFQYLHPGDVLATGWLRFNAATDTFSGTVAANESGTLHLGVIATDTTGASVTDYFDISFKNQQGIKVGAVSALPGQTQQTQAMLATS